MKAARAFLVFKAVEEFGQIVVYSPSSQDIEDERFELDFSLFLSSNAALDDILKAVKNVSEIADAVGEEVKTATLFHEENVQENLPANTSEAKPAEQAVHKENKPAQTKSKPAGKPVTNRTVRVDIENWMH